MMKNVCTVCCLLIMLTLWSCENESLEQEKTEDASEFTLVTLAEQLPLQQAAGESSAVIRTIGKGSRLKPTGAVSNFVTAVKLLGQTMEEPWLQVQTEGGEQGWVYGGGVQLADVTDEELANWRRQNRLQALFGKTLTEKIQAYRINFFNCTTAEELAVVYKESQALRDTMVELIGEQQTAQNTQELLNLFWLEEAFPGYVLQLVAEGTSYYLFEDYKTWLPLAKATIGREDDEYLQLCLTVYSRDSVAYFYPSWFIQTWDYGGHSLLGRGVHWKTLSRINDLSPTNRLFEQQVERIKSSVLQDIMQSSEGYWETQDKILTELDSILAQNYSFLNDADKIGLQTRRKMFEQAAENEIIVNQQSGGE